MIQLVFAPMVAPPAHIYSNSLDAPSRIPVGSVKLVEHRAKGSDGYWFTYDYSLTQETRDRDE